MVAKPCLVAEIILSGHGVVKQSFLVVAEESIGASESLFGGSSLLLGQDSDGPVS